MQFINLEVVIAVLIICWNHSVRDANLRIDARAHRSGRVHNRALVGTLQTSSQHSPIALGYEPADTCRSERKAKRPR